jgi:hypothetical protein
MRLSGFIKFAKEILKAAKKGGLKGPDLKKLEHLLNRTGKRNRILAQGILSTLAAGGASKGDIEKFGELLEAANERILHDKPPFTRKQQNELNDIFKRAFISRKTARWFSMQLDELVAAEINEFITGGKEIMAGVPEKKTIKFERKTSAKKKKKVRL